jgi:NAD(P)H dehydrogenase (quinone)
VRRVPTEGGQNIAVREGRSGFKLDQPAEIAKPEELVDYDAIIFGTPTRFGNMAAQMKNFLDQTGSLWLTGKLIGKVGSIFTSAATQRGGHETTILASLPILLHHGMIIVGLPYSAQGQMRLDEMTRGSPFK